MATNEKKLQKAVTLAHVWTETIKALQQRSDVWHKGAYASSVAELYTLLGACLDFYLSIKKDDASNLAMTQLLKQQNLPVTSGTSLPLRIVRLVMFSSSPRRAGDIARETTYANAVYMAARNGKVGNDFAAFAEANGGIDGLRRSAAKQANQAASNAVDKSELKQLAITRFKQPVKALSSEIVIHPDLNPEEGNYTLALLKVTDGKGVIVYACKSKAMLEAALAAAGEEFDKEDQAEALRLLQQQRAAENTEQMRDIRETLAGYVKTEDAPMPAVSFAPPSPVNFA